MNKNYKQVPINLSDYQIKDETLKDILQQVQFVSSKQLAKLSQRKTTTALELHEVMGTGLSTTKIRTEMFGTAYLKF